ncbi:Transcription factor [Coemansia sp. BCRC 34301]|nr:Transcription factor [Coemansia sp. BCRC 34301]
METHRNKPLDLAREPNPFEHSFALVQSEDPTTAKTFHDTANGGRTTEVNDSLPGGGGGRKKPTITLPPVTAINGPVDPAHMPMVWGAESLRSGPLSPAMLGGPTANSTTPKPLLPMTGTTPPLRMGLTDPILHTGLTPYIMGEAQAPVATRTFANMRVPAVLDTPGIQAEIRAVLNGQDITATPGGTLHIAPPRHPQQPPQPPPIPESRERSPHVAATQVSALVSQPLPRLTHLTPALRPPPSQAKRARRATDAGDDTPASPVITKRSRGRKRSKGYSDDKAQHELSSPARTMIKSDYNDGNSDIEGGNDDLDPYSTHGPDGQPLTEDEKRRQFLERNRIAALKCRQRKKKQLQELQERHDFMMQENERLRKEYMELREIAMQARALLVAHSDCSVARANGVYGADSLPPCLPAPSLHSLVPVNSSEAEYAKKIIDAIPPTSHGIPMHNVSMPAVPEHGARRSLVHSQRNSSMAPADLYYDPTRM